MIEKKMSVSEYIDSEFTAASKPHPVTIIRQIKSKKLPGLKVGGRWYVIKDVSTGDNLADEIMRRRHATS